MTRVMHEAARRLKPCRRSSAVIGCARLMLRLVSLLAAYSMQNILRRGGFLQPDAMHAPLNAADLFCAAVCASAVLACTPLRMMTQWQAGRLAGTLDENDLGFLSQCGSLWLYGRAIAVRLLSETVILLSVLPAVLLAAAAKCIWLTIPPERESILPLLTVLHLILAAAAMLLLPLRCLAASAALPFCYLKSPHESALRNLRQAFRCTRGQTCGILLNRLLAAPLLLLPFTAVHGIPVLLVSEQLRCIIAQRHLAAQPRSRFSGLELHAM
ncbi:MAG: hypothetical protein J6Z40_02585 [Oscillospiraceae bacterium]|nr:hypothetical protein [Oscillospiraceae bacterium]